MTEVNSEQIKGRCLCGAVTVTVTGPLGNASACHCSACTRWTGSVLMGLDIPRERVTYAGPIKSYASSSFSERAWCENCGTAVWFADTEGEGAANLELSPGLFDDFGGAALTRVVYADCAPSGVVLGGDLQRVSKADYEATHLHVEDAE